MTIEAIGKKLPPMTTKTKAASDDVGRAVLVAHPEDLKTVGETPRLDHRASGSGTLGECARIIRKNDLTGVTSVRSTLSECANAKYLFVVRVKSVTEPKQSGGTNAYESGAASG